MNKRGDSILDLLDLILCTDVLCCDDVSILPPQPVVTILWFHLNSTISLPQSTAQAITATPNFSKADWPGLCNWSG